MISRADLNTTYEWSTAAGRSALDLMRRADGDDDLRARLRDAVAALAEVRALADAKLRERTITPIRREKVGGAP
jgi:hypothetical protein